MASNCHNNAIQENYNKENMTVHLVNNITKVMNKPKLNEAIADTGITGHFILPGAPMDDIQPTAQPIEI